MDALVRRFLGMRDAKLAAMTVAALLAVVGLVFMAGSAGAEDCHGCGGDGSGGGTPPTISVANPSVVVPEGQAAANSGSFGDADGNRTVTITASVGSVTKNDSAGTWSWNFPTDDGSAQSQTVTITATDGADISTTTFSLTVSNVAPTAIFNRTTPVNEGSSFNLSLTNPFDPSSADTAAGFTYAFDCGEGSGFGGFSSNNARACTTSDNGTRTVRAKIKDKDGGETTYDSGVTVNNANPTATLNAPASVAEGGTATISLTNPSDPSSVDRNAGFRYAFDCNGGSLAGVTYANSSAGASTDCAYGDGPGTKTVLARIIDKNGGFNEYTKTITVNSVAPTATLEAPASADQGDNFTVSLTNASDPSSADTAVGFDYAFDCGDGEGYVSSGTASKSCLALDKPMTVKGKVMDKDGGFNEYTREVAINDIAPVGNISIGGGAVATNDRTVSLVLSATDPLPGSGVGHMRFRNENTETWSAWEPYDTGRQWLLSDGDGAKTVHVQYRDNAGNVSQNAISDGIQLDTVAPTEGSVKINNDAAKTKSLNVNLELNASDSGSGVSRMCVSNTPTCSAWEPFAGSKKWKLSGKKAGTKTVYVRFEDEARNVSTEYQDTIRYAPKKKK